MRTHLLELRRWAAPAEGKGCRQSLLVPEGPPSGASARPPTVRVLAARSAYRELGTPAACRFVGDMAHVMSFIVLLLKIRVVNSCAGVSLKTQLLYLMVFVARYIDAVTALLAVRAAPRRDASGGRACGP